MKMIKALITSTAILAASALFTSCENDGYSLNNYGVTIATINPINENSYSLTMDGGTTLLPVASNVYYKPKANQRAMINFTTLSDTIRTNGQLYDHAIKVNDIVDILTKNITTLNEATKDSLGSDLIAIENYWIGDGYLNIRFVFPFTYGAEKHFINMAKDETTTEPNQYVFLHNAYGDTNGFQSAGFVSFNLKPLIEEGKNSVEFKLKVNSFNGEKIYTINYDWTKNEVTRIPPENLSILPKSITEVE